uniref:Uncharacterized protein n=1 Tax=Arundo donax TaxID=35708 RepID=A0A0A9G689_ARUDO
MKQRKSSTSAISRAVSREDDQARRIDDFCLAYF